MSRLNFSFYRCHFVVNIRISAPTSEGLFLETPVHIGGVNLFYNRVQAWNATGASTGLDLLNGMISCVNENESPVGW